MTEKRVRPFLMFQGRAEEAIRLYVSLFADGEIVHIEKYGPAGPGAEGSVLAAVFSVGGQTVLCTDSAVAHGFGFTPAISLAVECADDAEIERLTAALSEGGAVLMPLSDYSFSRRFAWVNDRFGVSWQLNLRAS